MFFLLNRNVYVCDLLSHCDCELPMRSHPRVSNTAVLCAHALAVATLYAAS